MQSGELKCCVSEVDKDIGVGKKYVLNSFLVAHLPMILKFVSIFLVLNTCITLVWQGDDGV